MNESIGYWRKAYRMIRWNDLDYFSKVGIKFISSKAFREYLKSYTLIVTSIAYCYTLFYSQNHTLSQQPLQRFLVHVN